MAFSMHSHSGQFCPGHAKDSLEEIVLRAISLKFHLLALTEHMPRGQKEDLYPEEIAANETIATLSTRHTAYLIEALRLQAKYSSSIKLLIGFESDWIPRPVSSSSSSSSPFPTSPAAKIAANAAAASLIHQLTLLPGTDFFVGSVHHVHTIPIDYDRPTWELARTTCRDIQAINDGSAEEALFCDYFDAQWDMLRAVRPRVVGHFDLIRLFSDQPDGGVKRWKGKGVWERVRRNLKEIVGMGCLLEVNSSALRKGMKEPYPGREVCLEFLSLGGKFTLSDDSHGIAQVGLNYGRVSEYLTSLGITELYYLERLEQEGGEGVVGKEEAQKKAARLILRKMAFEGFAKGAFPTS